jgi:hypothetical protein
MADALKAEPPAEALIQPNGGWLKPFKRGQSGNPGGRNGEYGEMMRICRQFTPDAAYTLAALMFGSDDDRVRAICAKELMERAWGKPRDVEPDTGDPASLERRAQLIAAVMQLLSGHKSKTDPDASNER